MGWLGRLYQANFEKQERAVEFNHDRRRLGCNLRYDIQLQLNVEPWEGLGLHILRLIPPLIWPWKEDFWVLMWWRVLRNHDQNNLGTGRNWHLHEDHAKPNVYIAVCFRTWNDQHLVCGTMKLKFNPLSISVLFSCNCMMTKNGQRLLKILKYIYIYYCFEPWSQTWTQRKLSLDGDLPNICWCCWCLSSAPFFFWRIFGSKQKLFNLYVQNSSRV